MRREYKNEERIKERRETKRSEGIKKKSNERRGIHIFLEEG